MGRAVSVGLFFEKISRDMERNYYMSSEDAKTYGIIDEVITGSKAAALLATTSNGKK